MRFSIYLPVSLALFLSVWAHTVVCGLLKLATGKLSPLIGHVQLRRQWGAVRGSGSGCPGGSAADNEDDDVGYCLPFDSDDGGGGGGGGGTVLRQLS